jgi:FkbM family methyltransferase
MTAKSVLDKYFIKNPWLRKKVTRFLEGNEDRVVSLFGTPMKINTVREHGYLRASRLASHSSVFGDEAAVLISLSCLLPYVDTIVDAGANAGLYSSVLGKFEKLIPHLHVAAFDADPDTFQRLKLNLSSPKHEAHNVALSNQAGTLKFIRGAVSHVTTTVDQANAYSLGDEFEIESRRLDSFHIQGARILLKIDVEGQELEVLQGASEWFDDGRCVCVYLDGFTRREEVINFLSIHGFEFRDGRTLDATTDKTFALLALRTKWLPEAMRTPHSGIQQSRYPI